MSEFIAAILSPVNLFLTVLLAGCALYWGLVIIGGLTPDAFDVDLDTDVDADADVAGGPGMLGLAKFFNVGEVPLMILLSIFIGILWFAGIALHPYIGGWSFIFQVLMLIPMGLVALLLTKVATQPLVKVFRQLRAEENAAALDLLGERCVIVSGTANHRHGQAEYSTNGSPLKLNVKTASRQQTLSRGDEAVIVADRDEKGVYTVRGF